MWPFTIMIGSLYRWNMAAGGRAGTKGFHQGEGEGRRRGRRSVLPPLLCAGGRCLLMAAAQLPRPTHAMRTRVPSSTHLGSCTASAAGTPRPCRARCRAAARSRRVGAGPWPRPPPLLKTSTARWRRMPRAPAPPAAPPSMPWLPAPTSLLRYREAAAPSRGLRIVPIADGEGGWRLR